MEVEAIGRRTTTSVTTRMKVKQMITGN